MPSIDGLISGLDTTALIGDILSYQKRPIEQLQARIKLETERRTALLSFTGMLLGLQSRSNQLTQAALFSTPAVTSSDEDVLEAEGGENLPTGTYQFRVKQLAEGTQYTSSGFLSDSTLVGAGTLLIDAAGGAVDRDTELDLLNGGSGVSRGTIRITNRAGTSALVDLSTALTIDDVIEAINATPSLNITASIAGSGATNPGEALFLTDSSGGAGNLVVQEVSGGSTARDLGLLASVAADTLEGDRVLALDSDLPLRILNDELGVRVAAGNDLEVTQQDGTTFTVDLSDLTTVGEVVSAINNAAGNTDVTVSVSGRHLLAVDTSSGASTFAFANVGSGSAATDLGLTATAAGGTITGDPILADMNSALLKTLQGGSGITSGSILITNRSGSNETIDLSSAETIRDVLNLINANSIDVTASFNESGDGLLLVDGSGGSGVFKVEEVGGGSIASELGILEASGVSSDRIEGDDVEIQYIGENTLLSTLNGGKGVFEGSILITDASGRSFTVDLSQETTIEDVLGDINGASGLAGSDIVASINSSGNGILLSASSGTGTLTVAEVSGGSTAQDLNILGSADAATPLVLDGSFERTIDISASDSLETLADTINSLDIGVTASVIDDGSSIAPKRLHLVSDQAGREGGMIARTSGGTDLSFSLTAKGQDAVLFYGGTGGRSVVVRSQTNEFRDVVKGLTVTARSVSSSPVLVSATRDLGKVKEAIRNLVESYNEVIDNIRTLASFNPDTNKRGLLLGESAMRTVERQISYAVIRPVLGLGSGENLASQAGLRVTSKGKLEFNSSDFDEMASENPDAIRQIYTRSRPLDNRVLLEDFRDGDGVDFTDAGAELRILKRDGTSFDVDLSGDLTVKDLLASINNATGNGGTVTASIAPSGRSIRLVDSTSGSTDFEVEGLNSSPAYSQLGLDEGADSDGGDTLTGSEIDLSDDLGVSRRLFDVLKALLDTETGLLQSRSDNYDRTIEDLKSRAEAKSELLASRELQLRRQFAQLEVLLGQNQNTLQRLTAALGGITGTGQ